MKPMILGGVIVLTSAVAVMADGQATPPAGDYRIDSESVTTTTAGPMVMKTIQRIDGATGATTVEQSNSDGSSATQSYPGQGPYKFWVASGPPPPVAANCANRSFSVSPGGGSAFEAMCSGGQAISNTFRKLADGRWERIFETNLARGGSAPADPRTNAAMAPVIAQIEQTIRTGPPAEAEAA